MAHVAAPPLRNREAEVVDMPSKKAAASENGRPKRERTTLRAGGQRLTIELRQTKGGSTKVLYVQHISRTERLRSPEQQVDNLMAGRERVAQLVAEARKNGWHEQEQLLAIPPAPTAAKSKK